MVSGQVQPLANRKSRPAVIQVAFNVATLAISNCFAYALAHAVGPVRGVAKHALLLGVAGLALLIVNTLMVSVVLCLIQNAPIASAWRSLRSWVLPYYFAGGLWRPCGFGRSTHRAWRLRCWRPSACIC